MRLTQLVSLNFARTFVSATDAPPLRDTLALDHFLLSNIMMERQTEPVTRTLEPTATESASVETSAEDEQRPTKTLTPVDQPLPLAATIGLIMPNPWEKNYVGESFSPHSKIRTAKREADLINTGGASEEGTRR
jgi:hypothetical protein